MGILPHGYLGSTKAYRWLIIVHSGTNYKKTSNYHIFCHSDTPQILRRNRQWIRKTLWNQPISEGFGPSGATRTPGLLIPNLSGKLFPLVYSGFRRFLICFTYSLALLSPLFPGVPAPSVVIYVVKNASRPVFGEHSPVPDGKRFTFQTVCIVTPRRGLCKLFLREQQLSSCGAIDKEEWVYSMKIIAGSFPSTEYKSLNTGIIVRDLWHSPLTIPLFYITI